MHTSHPNVHSGAHSVHSAAHGAQHGSAQAADAPRCPFRRMFGPGKSAISARLKEETRPQHVAAEHHPLQQGAVRGTIDRRTYAALTAQLAHIQGALEEALDRHAAREPRTARVFAQHCRRTHAFNSDLALLDPAGEVRQPLPAAVEGAAWIAAMGTTAPVALLGALYVFEGSTNGGKFIAPILRRAWGLQPGEGLQSLDPHGARTHELWVQFRSAIDDLRLTPQERTSIIAAAGETFDRISACMDQVAATYSTTTVCSASIK